MGPSVRVAVAWATATALVLVGCSEDDDPSTSPDAATQTRAEPSSHGSTSAAPPDGDEGADDDFTTETVPPHLAMPEPPGELIDVDGHLMHLYCTGEGDPTVLLEAGLGESSLMFRPFQEEVEAMTRVCAYDRAGHGWSEPGPGQRTGERIVGELESLVQAAGEPGPYVLVGHSFGGLIMLMFAEANPEDVAGVVLIDTPHPDHEEAFAELPAVAAMEEDYFAEREAIAERIEAGEVSAKELVPLAPLTLPPQLRYQWAALHAEGHDLRTTLAEGEAWEETLSQVGGEGSLGDTPLIVLAPGIGMGDGLPARVRTEYDIAPEDSNRFDAIWRSLQEDHVNQSTNGRLVVAQDSYGYIHDEEPDVVLEAIQSVTGTN